MNLIRNVLISPFQHRSPIFRLIHTVVFVCSKCHNSLKIQNTTTTSPGSRRSLLIANRKSTSIDQSSSNSSSTQTSKLDKIMKNSDDQTQLLNQILSRINETPQINQSQQQQQLSGDNVCNCNNNDAINHMIDKMNLLSTTVVESISSQFNKILDSIANLKLINEINASNRYSIDNNSSIANKLHNWDMSMSTSATTPGINTFCLSTETPNRNANKYEEVFEIYRRFEKLNWESIDIINKKIDNLSSHMIIPPSDSINGMINSL